eukprot:Awhi_evm1s4755
METLKLVRENILKEFQQIAEVQTIMKEEKEKTQVVSHLASLGLVSHQNNTLDTLKENSDHFATSTDEFS